MPFNNDEGQDLVIAVGQTCEPEAGTLTLTSSLGQRDVGTATVDPPCGPVGTTHELVVEVMEQWEDVVGRVTVTIDADPSIDVDEDGDLESRGEQEYVLERDSAAPVYAISLQSQGIEGETRDDVFRVVLWQPEELQPTAGTETQ
ncbi:MAG: hypothetical protein KTR31_26185 [Myxococcales bacterium]|nr:hypothetical protein [Myxococcales bacterium]